MTDKSLARPAPWAGPRVPFVDTARFVLATCVLLSHIGRPPLFPDLGGELSVLNGIRVALENVINGPAAVILFFVISGFCIHLPFRSGPVESIGRFYLRRNVRIVLPAAVAVGIAGPLDVRLSVFSNSILWSLVCEEIYYFLYPAISWVRFRFGWKPLITGAAGAWAVLSLLAPPGAAYTYFGIGWTWALGLFPWLAGARLAESFDEALSPRRSGARDSRVILARMGIAASFSVLAFAHFHLGVSLPLSLNLLALVGPAWLALETERALRRGSMPLDALGQMSYSIYLFHLPALALFARIGLPDPEQNRVGWFVASFGALALCALFWFVVERPSHRLARWLSRAGESVRAPRSPA